MQANRKLLKLKVKEGEIFLKYHRPDEDSAFPETITIESAEPPRQELKDAMQNMVDHVIAIAELPASWREKLTVRGVTITRNDIDGLVITALRKLDGSNSPLVINTPHFTREERDENQDTNVYSFECGRDLDQLEKEAFLYADGKRQQHQLFAPEPADHETLLPMEADPLSV